MNPTALLLLLLRGVMADLEFLRPSKLQTVASPEVQREAAGAIISKYSDYFDVKIDPSLFHEEKDMFSFHTVEEYGRNITMIKASSGVAAVWGFHYYIKKYFNAHIGWQVSNIKLPYLNTYSVKESVVANDRFRYYQNVCTVSYSFVWWSENDWKQHIDWMAMNGINLVLAPLGQEAIWMKIYKELGMTEDEIAEHFTGPAFLSWLRMGNMRGWGGPLPSSWQQRSTKIQGSILEYMRNLGMVPVLPAFAGHVPRAFRRLYPNSTLYQMQKWNGFSDQYCCPLFIDPGDKLFRSIGEKFLTEINGAYGTSHIYNSDPFNEIRTSSWSTQFVESVGDAIFSSMSSIDSQAVWLIQNWMFINAPDLWPRDRVKSFLRSVPRGRILVLDLQAEQWPHYNAFDMYFGQPFVWCMLHNFGGTLGMFGNTDSITREVYRARSHKNSTMIGMGLTPEGINQNYFLYELMLESAWRPQPIDDLEEWTAAYAQRRYGCNSTARAWRYLLKSVYSFRGLNSMHGQYAITMQPSLRDIHPWAWYSSYDLTEAWEEFVLAAETCNTTAFYHDLTDVTRQVLQYRADQLYRQIVLNFPLNTWATGKLIDQYLEVMGDMDGILSKSADFQLYDWLEKARSAAEGNGDAVLYEMNARNQITLWGPNGEISDYACKQWAGMFEHYYIPRWRMFLAAAMDAKTNQEYFDEKLTQEVVRETIQREFSQASIRKPDLTEWNNRPVSLASKLFLKWYLLPGVVDLPKLVILPDPKKVKTLKDVRDEEMLYRKNKFKMPQVTLVH